MNWLHPRLKMKNIRLLICLSILISCSSPSYLVPIQHLDPKKEAHHFKDSLLASGIDSIVLYLDRCSGCIPGTLNPSYIYWIKNGEERLTKFTEESNYNRIDPREFPFDFIARNFKQIKADSILPPDYGLLHYNYEELYLKIGAQKASFRIDQFEKAHNLLPI